MSARVLAYIFLHSRAHPQVMTKHRSHQHMAVQNSGVLAVIVFHFINSDIIYLDRDYLYSKQPQCNVTNHKHIHKCIQYQIVVNKDLTISILASLGFRLGLKVSLMTKV